MKEQQESLQSSPGKGSLKRQSADITPRKNITKYLSKNIPSKPVQVCKSMSMSEVASQQSIKASSSESGGNIPPEI
jgi:hypothetical protein